MKLRTTVLLITLALALNAVRAAEKPGSEVVGQEDPWVFLENEHLRIGVDRSRGACIGFFGKASDDRNVLNHHDHGRFIQQSYYGDPDGSKWNGKPWRYNPIQGGSWRGENARILEFRVDDESGLYAKVEACHWANGNRCPEAIMEQWIKLDGDVAKVRFQLTYTGKDQEESKSQEMPAVFVDAVLQNLVYVQNGKLVRRKPGWPNESGQTSENWVAYLDDQDWGIGVQTPGTSKFTCYRYLGDGKPGPRGSACSYIAPLRDFRLQGGQVIEYEFYLTLGSLEEIRSRFTDARHQDRITAKTRTERPNIIMVFVDDWGYADLGVLKNRSDVKTPNLDKLSQRGVLFTDAYITAPQCSPSRAGLITGRYQQRFGFDSIPDCPLPLSQTTIADHMKAVGYVTGMVGKWHLQPNALSTKWARENQPEGIHGKRVQVRRDLAEPYLPAARGFDEFFMGERNRYWCNYDLAGNDLEREGQFIDDPRFRVDVQSDAGLAFIKRNHSDPFFLYLAYYAPHVPLEAPKRYLDRFPGDMPERRRTGLAMINAVDEGIGRIVRLLDDEGLTKNTLIMFTSDNGAPLGAHTGQVMADILPVNKPGPAWDGSRNDPLIGEKGMLAEGGIRVPMIWSWPSRLPMGKKVADPVISLDMTASALAVAGITPKKELDGVNLIPHLTGRDPITETRDLYWRFWNQAAIRSGDWKYIMNSSGREMLFNLRRDIEEHQNVLVKHPTRVDSMRTKLARWVGQLDPAGLPAKSLNNQERRWYKHYFPDTQQDSVSTAP